VKTPLITEIQRFSLQDGPGIRTTVFVKGCPLRCPWCHNPETQDPRRQMYYYDHRCRACGRCAAICPAKASTLSRNPAGKPTLKVDREKCINCLRCTTTCLNEARGAAGNVLSIDEILREVLSDKLFYKNSGGGVTLSGGDPLMYPDFVAEMSRRLRQEEVHLAVETSCFPKQWETVEPLVDCIDLFLVDLKCLDPVRHEDVVKWPLDVILRNLQNLFARDAAIRIRIPVIPGFNDAPEDFRAYVDFLAAHADKIRGVDVLNYHSYGESKYKALGRMDTYQFAGVQEAPADHVIPFVRALKERGIPAITIGGLLGCGKQPSLEARENNLFVR
jgi:pyruvate formate lyase activating enzyme